MFILKLKGDVYTTKTDRVELKLKGISKMVDSHKSMWSILKEYEVNEVKIKVDGEFRDTWNLYFKEFDQTFICEGLM